MRIFNMNTISVSGSGGSNDPRTSAVTVDLGDGKSLQRTGKATYIYQELDGLLKYSIVVENKDGRESLVAYWGTRDQGAVRKERVEMIVKQCIEQLKGKEEYEWMVKELTTMLEKSH